MLKALREKGVDPVRVEHAAFTWFWLLGIEPTDLRSVAERQPLEFSQFFTLTPIAEQRLEFIRTHLDGIVARYGLFRRSVSLSDALRTYRADYVLFDKQRDAWDVHLLGVGAPLLENGRFVLYPVE